MGTLCFWCRQQKDKKINDESEAPQGPPGEANNAALSTYPGHRDQKLTGVADPWGSAAPQIRHLTMGVKRVVLGAAASQGSPTPASLLVLIFILSSLFKADMGLNRPF